jgi:hypothetical protein
LIQLWIYIKLRSFLTFFTAFQLCENNRFKKTGKNDNPDCNIVLCVWIELLRQNRSGVTDGQETGQGSKVRRAFEKDAWQDNNDRRVRVA